MTVTKLYLIERPVDVRQEHRIEILGQVGLEASDASFREGYMSGYVLYDASASDALLI